MSLTASALGLHPYACLFIDTTWRDLLRAYGDIATAQDTAAAQTRIQKLFHADCLVAISARTAFDAWLRVRAFPRGSEIVMTAINIPDMIKVMREHGIVPVPVDVCVRTLAPAAAALEALITPKTVAVLVAQIYGRQFPLDAFVDVARRHRLPLIEDLAESYAGPGFTGSPDAHLSLFSFGPIKYNTAFGGGIAVVRDAAVLAQMRALHSSYATRTKTEMLHKLAKYSVVMAFLNVPVLSGSTMRLCRALGVDHKAYVVSLLRGFPDKFFEKLRHQPDPAMLAILERRLREFDAADFALSATNGEVRGRDSLTMIQLQIDRRWDWGVEFR
jgi:perosamine synthetase